MNIRSALRPVVLLAVAALVVGACSRPSDPPTGDHVAGDPVEGPSRILGWKLHAAADDHLVVDVDYVLTGAEGTAVMVSAELTLDGLSAPYSVRPEVALVGRNTARIHLAAQHEEMPFTSDGLRFKMYPAGGSVFTELRADFPRVWSRR